MCSLKASKRHYIVQARGKRVIFGRLIFGRFFFFFSFLFFVFFNLFSFTAMKIAHNWRGELISEGAYSPLWGCLGDWVEMFVKCILGRSFSFFFFWGGGGGDAF